MMGDASDHWSLLGQEEGKQPVQQCLRILKMGITPSSLIS